MKLNWFRTAQEREGVAHCHVHVRRRNFCGSYRNCAEKTLSKSGILSPAKVTGATNTLIWKEICKPERISRGFLELYRKEKGRESMFSNQFYH